MKFFIVSIFTFFVSAGFAATLFEGSIELKPTQTHKPPMIAVMQVQGEGTRFDGLVFNFEKKVMGKLQHLTSESMFYTPVGADQKKQLNCAYKIEGASHDWYMLFVGNFDVATQSYNLQFYTVLDSAANVANQIRDFVISAPAGWKPMGSGTIKVK